MNSFVRYVVSLVLLVFGLQLVIEYYTKGQVFWAVVVGISFLILALVNAEGGRSE